MVFPYPDQEPPLSWYNFGVSVVWPNLMLWTKRDWRGQEHLGQPGEGMVCAANHISWFDPLILLHYANDMGRPARFLAKDSLFEIPFVGTVMTGAGTIPVHRESGNAADAVSAAVTAVEEGEMVFIYPEGTITRDPDLWPMSGKTGAARVALLGDVPLVPVAHWGAQEIMGPYKVELKILPRKTIHVLAGEPVDIDDLRGRPLTEPLLAEATTRVMDAITELEAELRDAVPPAGRWNRKAEERQPVLHGVAAYEEAMDEG
ncbi:MAG: 1-acyl-sn-glycerol-3-phosphate acyltransferase [Actinobacteria bacterium]|nr:1-acyl-sn-glycerol-3-phosphate acyltransferase [Actinomycetota bacterium]